MQTKPRLEWRSQARADLLKIIAYIADDNPDAAQELKSEIEAKVAKLPDHPKLYRASTPLKACVRWSPEAITPCFIERRRNLWRW